MKLTVSNTYDVSQIANSKSYQELQTFFDYFSSLTTDVVQGFNKNITLGDNLNFQTISLVVKHGIPINIGKYSPIGIFLDTEANIVSYRLVTNSDSTKNLTIYLKSPQNCQAKAAIWQVGSVTRYTVIDTTPYLQGDIVSFSGFGTSSNNGNFLVVDTDSENNYLYVINRKRSSATGDELRSGFVGSVLDSVKVTMGIFNA